jgi:hypothetical protein
MAAGPVFRLGMNNFNLNFNLNEKYYVAIFMIRGRLPPVAGDDHPSRSACVGRAGHA